MIRRVVRFPWCSSSQPLNRLERFFAALALVIPNLHAVGGGKRVRRQHFLAVAMRAPEHGVLDPDNTRLLRRGLVILILARQPVPAPLVYPRSHGRPPRSIHPGPSSSSCPPSDSTVSSMRSSSGTIIRPNMMSSPTL